MDSLTRENIISKINSSHVQSENNNWTKNLEFNLSIDAGTLKHAAVLVPLFLNKNAWHVLFTRRTDKLLEHSGQVAFPGGQLEPNDEEPIAAAIREAHEEIGLEPKDIQVIGALNNIFSITNFRITPIVAFIPWPYDFVLAQDEVSRVFSIPFNWLKNPENYQVIIRDIPPKYIGLKTVFYLPYKNEILWGISAKITLQLIEILK